MANIITVDVGLKLSYKKRYSCLEVTLSWRKKYNATLIGMYQLSQLISRPGKFDMNCTLSNHLLDWLLFAEIHAS